MAFNPDSTGVYNGNYFGFEFDVQGSALSLLSVCWDATVSYRGGTCRAPESMVECSTQVEIYDVALPGLWQRGIYTIPFSERVGELSEEARVAALRVIAHLEGGGSECDEEVARDIVYVNECSEWLNDYVYSVASEELASGRVVGVVGGDHSVPLGLIRALGEKYGDVGILQIDAHMDLRDGYEGFVYSHASIMRRALECIGIQGLVQVGVRDFCEPELEFATSDDRVVYYTDGELSARRFEGVSWRSQCDEIVDRLPQNVYISFDVDGLERSYCPSTGTPVPGGLTYNEAVYLLLAVVRSGRRVVGFDLCEVVPSDDDQWDAIVGARLLYKLCSVVLSCR